jgi:hypothetical protein
MKEDFNFRRDKKIDLFVDSVKFRKMIFTVLTNLAFAFLGPLGAAAVVVGDWWFNLYMITKVVETVVPNGPAIVGNISELVPVVTNTLYSAAVPLFAVNYTGLLQEYVPVINLTDLQGNATLLVQQLMNLTEAVKGG